MDEIVLYEQLLSRLKALPYIGGSVHEGVVKGKVPEDANGNVLPYLVLFGGLASDLPQERCLSGEVDQSTLNWLPQINAVGATPGVALKVAVQVRKALTGARIGNHWLKPQAEAFRVSRPILDNQANPSRFFLPLNFEVTTN